MWGESRLDMYQRAKANTSRTEASICFFFFFFYKKPGKPAPSFVVFSINCSLSLQKPDKTLWGELFYLVQLQHADFYQSIKATNENHAHIKKLTKKTGESNDNYYEKTYLLTWVRWILIYHKYHTVEMIMRVVVSEDITTHQGE